jgi:transcription-repair coupling factor (superfamily II helicase)
MHSLAQIESIRDELADRFGPVPQAVQNLLFQLEMKLLATKAAIERVSTEGGQILIEVSPDRSLPTLNLDSEVIRRSRRGLWINARENQDWPEVLKTTLETFAGERQAVLQA